eukprot:gene2807-5525_t
MAAVEPGSWIWIQNERDRYLPAQVINGFRKGEATTVRTEDGEDHRLSAADTADIQDCNPEALDSKIDDLINISDLNEMSILHNLRIRYKEDLIYTNVSSILISVNPFKLLPLYTPAMLDTYREGTRGKPPHIFAVAHDAYSSMLSEAVDQSVVISGESGAGKSEATKLILQFLADVSGRVSSSTPASATSTMSVHLEQQILAANPILEAFGNAKTLRNNNSSRFGKLITVNFDKNGAIIGGGIINYLLEKSRVVSQSKGERNYHIFYQLIAGGEADTEMQTRLKLQDAEMFHYVNQSGVTAIEGVSDDKDFEDIQNSMRILNFSPQDQAAVYETVAGVLHFGNVRFKAENRANQEDVAVIANEETLAHAARLWGLEPSEITKSLTSKNIGTKEVIMVNYNVDQAQDARDAMVKRVYAELFQIVVDRINKVLAASKIPRHKFVGVLDIFGFESFDTNSFEQLCINYCNEKLQFHFNEHIFRLEQNLYESEGIKILATVFKDNQPTLDLLEAKVTGVFSLCDEEISVPRGSDEGMLQKIFQKHDGKHPNMIKPKPNACKDAIKCFGILHYAGPVFYNVTNFLEKNKDQLHSELVGVLKQSSSKMIITMFPDDPEDSRGNTKTRSAAKKTLASQFKTQLNDLMATLNSTFPHFVRCMKPNDDKCGNLFVAQRMQDQLRYAGLVEVCRIRKLGYSVRRDFESFLKRYRCFVLSATSIDELLAGLVEKKVLVDGEWAKGYTKIFMRIKQSQELELAREGALLSVTKSIQRIARGYLMRMKFKSYRRHMANLREAITKREEKALTEAIDMSFELPYGGAHLPIIQEAKMLQSRLREEHRVYVLLENAIAAREMNSLKSSVATAQQMKPAYEPPILLQAQELIVILEKELETRTKLLAAIAARDRKALEALLLRAAELGLDCNETRQGSALKTRLEEEDQAVENLKQAMIGRILINLTTCIDKCTEMGIENAEVTAARTLQAKLQVEQLAINAVVSAIQKRDMDVINNALSRATSLGLSEDLPELKAAIKLKDQLKTEFITINALEKATNSRDLKALDDAIALAFSQDMPVDSVDALQSAVAMRDTIKTEMTAMENLKKAMNTESVDSLSEALSEISRLGLRGVLVEEARAKAKALGAQNEARDHLAQLVLCESVEEIELALDGATKFNIMHTPEAVALVSRKKHLLEEEALARELSRLTETAQVASLQELSRLIATASRQGLSSKYTVVLEASKEKAKALGEEVKITMQIQQAVTAGDLDALNIAIDEANAKGMDTSFVLKKKTELETKRRIVSEFGPALVTKDMNVLVQLLAKAELYSISDDRVTQARMYVERCNLVDKTYKTFKEASASMNLAQLNEALRTAIELGLDTAEVADAQILRGKLEIVQGAKSQLIAAEQSIAVKAESGLTAEDLEPLTAALSHAESVGMPREYEAYVHAQSVYSTYSKHIEVKEQLFEAAGSGDRAKLRAALNSAEDLDMRLDIIAKVRRILKEKDALAEMADTGMSAQGYEATEKARQVRRDLIRHPRFELKNFPGLRSPDDFAKGVILNKQSVKDKFLCWQSSVITKSLTEVTKEFSKMAVQIHKDLLGYMGDKHMPFPAMLAQDVLRKGFESPVIRDEIFLQIIKQLTGNPRPESIAKGWQMMCMCVSTFPPSKRFENFLLHYILEKKEKGRGAVVDYSKYCFRTLEGMLASGESSGFVPSVEEILAYKERPPILATIELVDGQVITEDLPVTPDLNVGKVLEICSGWLDLRDPRAYTMGLFVYDLGEIAEATQTGNAYDNSTLQFADLVRTPRPLRNEDCMGDVIVQKARQKRNFKFVLKKKLFLHQHKYIGNDPYYERLVYLQCEDEVIVQGNIPIYNESLGLRLAAISMAVAYGDTMPSSAQGLIDENVIDFVPPSLRDQHSSEGWATRILTQRLNCILADPEELQKEFVVNIQQDNLYGMHWFYVYKGNNTPALVTSLPRALIIGYNADGMHIFDLDRSRLKFFAYADIYRWGGSSTQFSLIIWDSATKESFELILVTAQAADMAAIILDHIRAIMSLKDGDPTGKT